MADPITPLAATELPAAPLAPGLSGATTGGPTNEALLRRKAQEFEAMYLTEMLRLARPTSQPAGPFGGGFAEESWRMFMDQALGQAMAAQGGAALQPAIEAVLRGRSFPSPNLGPLRGPSPHGEGAPTPPPLAGGGRGEGGGR
jgi:flagellar protein FlgJ